MISPRLEAFAAVVKNGSFSKTAKQLFISQPALSQRIALLEEELGTTLLIRERTGVRTTDAGQRLLRHYQFLQTAQENFIADFHADPKDGFSGAIRIAGFSTCMRSIVMPKLAGFIRKNPKLHVELNIREIQDLPNLLLNGEADYIILDRRMEKDNIESLQIGEEENVWIESKKFKNSVWFLDHDENDSTTFNFFKQQSKSPKNIKRRFLDDVYGIIEGVRHGMGSAVVPKHLIENDPKIQIVTGKKSLKVPFVLNYFKQAYYNKLHHEILKILS